MASPPTTKAGRASKCAGSGAAMRSGSPGRPAVYGGRAVVPPCPVLARMGSLSPCTGRGRRRGNGPRLAAPGRDGSRTSDAKRCISSSAPPRETRERYLGSPRMGVPSMAMCRLDAGRAAILRGYSAHLPFYVGPFL